MISYKDYAPPQPSQKELERRWKRQQWDQAHAAERRQREADRERMIRQNDAELAYERKLYQQRKTACHAPDSYEGLAVVYGLYGDYCERLGGYPRFMPGCFPTAHAGNVAYMWEHDTLKTGAVATVTALWEVDRKELPPLVQIDHPEATGGLVVVRRYADHENGREALRWLKSGGIKGISVGVHVKRSRGWWIDGKLMIDVLEAELAEISDGRVAGAQPGTLSICGTKQLSLLQGRYKR